MLDILVDGNGKGPFAGGEVAELVCKYNLLVWLILNSIVIFLQGEVACLAGKEGVAHMEF